MRRCSNGLSTLKVDYLGQGAKMTGITQVTVRCHRSMAEDFMYSINFQQFVETTFSQLDARAELHS